MRTEWRQQGEGHGESAGDRLWVIRTKWRQRDGESAGDRLWVMRKE